MNSTILFRILVVVALLVAIDFYVFQGLRTLTRELSPRSRNVIHAIYWLINISIFLSIIIGFAMIDRNSGPSHYFSKIFAFFLIFFLPKLFFAVVLLLEDAFRFIHYLFDLVASSHQEKAVFDGRRKFISQFALFLAAIPFAGILHGITRGKYNYTVHRVELFFDDLPKEFDGFTISQISDVHSGSFTNEEEVAYGIDMINEQKSDLILFTGDLVNNKAVEMEPWIKLFSSLDAPLGKFSVLGNHDYGGYINWSSSKEKAKNDERLVEIHREMGFRLMRNEHVKIKKGNAFINLIGVHNWGLPPFPQLGDLDVATAGMEQGFNVLMSHDPSHWKQKVLDYKKHMHVTMSGHTHGMQFGIEIPGFKWSPVKYRYAEWAGLYSEGNRHLYVNRGFGYIGFHGRVGIWPEITVLTLRKKAEIN